jgi:hypothetical protein
MSDAQDLSDSVEGDVNNFLKKTSKVDESPVIEGFDDFFEVTDLSAPGVGSASGSGSGKGANGDRSGGGDFAITVNGTAPTTGSDGLPVYASTVSLDCNSGHVILLTGGSATASNEIDHSGSFSASFPVSDGFAGFGVYGQVTYNTTTSNQRVTPSGDPVSGSIVIATAANVGTGFKEGWSRDSSFASNSRLVYMFKIGVVNLQKDGNNRRVFVTQIESGNHNINFSSETDSSVSPTVDIGDGFRQVTLCINGDPFTGFIDVRGIKKV